jgi:PAS domain S-box-containing protein
MSSDREALRQTIERLQASVDGDLELMRSLVLECPHGVIVCNAAGEITFQNPAALRIWAGRADAPDVASWARYRAFHPDGRPFTGEDWAMARCLRERRAIEADAHLIQRFDGTTGTLVGSCAPLLSPDGELLGAMSVFVDVSHIEDGGARDTLAERLIRRTAELEEAERRARALYSVTANLAAAASEQDIVAAVTSDGLSLVGAVAAVVILEREDGTLERAGDRGLTADTQARFPTLPRDADMPIARAIRDRQVVWLPDPAAIEREFPGLHALTLQPPGSLIAVPLAHQGHQLGGLSLVFATPTVQTSATEELVTAIASHVGQALVRVQLFEQNSQLYRNAQLARDRHRALLMQAPAAMAITRGPTHDVHMANDAYRQLFDGAEVVGRPMPASLAPEDAQVIFDLLDLVFRTGEVKVVREVRMRVMGAGGSDERWFDWTCRPARDLDGQINGVMCFPFEVTDRVRARRSEQAAARALRQHAAQLALSAEIGDAFTKSRGIGELLPRVMRPLVDHLGVASARVWTIADRDGTLELRGQAGLQPPDGGDAQASQLALLSTLRRPTFSDDVGRDPRVIDGAWAAAEGLRAFAAYPLMIEDRVVGVLALFVVDAFAPEVLRALSGVVDTLAIGVERELSRRRLSQETEALETLNRVGQTLAAELDVDRLVQAIIDLATRLAGAERGALYYLRGDPRAPYAIVGAPHDGLATFPLSGAAELFTATLPGQRLVRIDDLSRHAEHAELVGAGLRSYLGVPVVSRAGKVIGGLFFADSRPGAFDRRAEQLLVGVAAQAAVAIDNASLFREAQALIKKLERSNSELDQFAYVASHDLKAPLRGIANLSDWIESDLGDAVTESTREHLRLLRNRAHRLEALTDGILAYSRAGKAHAAPERVDVRELLTDTIELLAVAPPAQVVLPDHLPELHTSRIVLQQVFMNLIGNALKHAQRADVRVTVSAVDRGHELEFRVADNGPGIDDRYQERIWRLFHTLETRDRIEGAGIGLAVVRKLVQGRSGRAWVESSLGKGATFCFTWPKDEP